MLRLAGLKATSSRLSILELFSDECYPRDAEGILGCFKKDEIDLVTIYRTLSSLEEKGILRRVDLHKEAKYYELNQKHHHHLICNGCGAIEKVRGCGIDKLSSQIISESLGFVAVSDHSLEFFGTCKSCAQAA